MKFFSILLSLASSSLIHAAEDVTAIREGQQVVIRTGKHEILRYQAEPGGLPRPEIPKSQLRGGYIQSIHTPTGRLVTDDFPADHPHHHGVWNPWTKTEFEGRHPDFWNMGNKTGRVEFVKLDSVWQKEGVAGFTSFHRLIDMTASPEKAALLDTWTVMARVDRGAYLIDFTSTQTCASDSPLDLLQYRYGGLGFRGHAAWNGAGNCQFLTASGQTDRLKIDTSREKWCWIGGKVDGETCGVLILGHPDNDRFPQPVRANPDQPFFCFAPVQLGGMRIAPGHPYISHYRLIVMDGPPNAADAERRWQEYAAGR